ncbi:MAG: SDR family oxidoreductase [Clostridia bacterium]|nr:SDR family oxidoreductase [Clostridia bacterium]
MKKLDGKVAIVIGGSTGMGYGAAKVMAQHGALVTIVSSSKKVYEATESLKKEGIEVVGYQLNIIKSQEVNEIFKRVVDQFGKLDILVNAAGVAQMEPFLEMNDETRDNMFNINVMGLWNCCRAAIPYMVEANYGKIVNFSSVTGFMVADTGSSAYAASKSAILGLTKALAMEFVDHNITINAICPGIVLTPMIMNVAKELKPGNPQVIVDSLASGIPMKRLGTIEEAGDLVAFLASDESRYITGTQIVLDGGSTLPETKV